MPIVLNCHKGIGPMVTGTALVAQDNFSARYDLDRLRGIFSRPAHKLHGQSYLDRILVLQTAKGGVASAWMLHEMTARGMAPKAIIFDRANTILAQGAAFAELTMVDRFETGDPTTLIRTGDTLKIEPDKGRVTILDRDPNEIVLDGSTSASTTASLARATDTEQDWRFSLHRRHSCEVHQSAATLLYGLNFRVSRASTVSIEAPTFLAPAGIAVEEAWRSSSSSMRLYSTPRDIARPMLHSIPPPRYQPPLRSRPVSNTAPVAIVTVLVSRLASA